jgi:hypothetical protein
MSSIGKMGIDNERKKKIPMEVINSSGEVTDNKEEVLEV